MHYGMLNKNKKENNTLKPKNRKSKDLLFASRLKYLRNKLGLSQEKVSILLGVNINTVQNYEAGQYPKGEHAISLAKVLECSLDWLLLGQDSVDNDAKEEQIIDIKNETSVPVTGLASCGLKDWFNPESIAMRVMLPADIKSSTAIAIIAIGNSMIPLGIRSGNIAICDTSAKLEKGDIAYVLKRDGTASIKVFIERDEKWLHVQGWLPPNETGGQKPYIEKCLLDIVKLTAPVIYVRVKA